MLGVGFSDLINRKLVNQNVGNHSDTKISVIAKHKAVFRALGKKFGKTDWTRLVREERNSGHD